MYSKMFGHVPGDPQAHLDLASQPAELLVERVVVEPEDPADRLGAVGDQAEGHRQDGALGHQLVACTSWWAASRRRSGRTFRSGRSLTTPAIRPSPSA